MRFLMGRLFGVAFACVSIVAEPLSADDLNKIYQLLDDGYSAFSDARYDEALRNYGAALELIERYLPHAVGEEYRVLASEFVFYSYDAASIAQSVGRLALARQLASTADEVAEDLQGILAQSPRASAYYVTASKLYADLGHYEASERKARAGIEIAVKLGDREAEAGSRNNLGLALRFLGRHDEALHEYDLARRICEERGDSRGTAITLNNIALVQFFAGRFSEAAEICADVQEFVAGNAEEGWASLQGRLASCNLAAIYERNQKYRLAFDVYRDLLAEEGLGTHEEARYLVGLGRACRALGDPHKAIAHYERAISRFREVGDQGGLSNAYLAVGQALAENLEHHARAQDMFRKALAIALDLDDRNEALFDFVHLGMSLLATESFSEAKKCFEEAVSIAQETNYAEGLWSALGGLGRTYHHLGDSNRALQVFRQCLDLVEEQRARYVAPPDRVSFLTDKADLYASAAYAALRVGKDARSEGVAESFAIVERGRARSLLDGFEAKPLDLDQLQSMLPDDHAFVEYVVALDGAFVFVVTSSRAEAVVISTSPGYESLVKQLGRRRSSYFEFGDGRWTEETLSKALVEPLGSQLQPWIKHLVVVGDQLQFLQFGALTWSSGDASQRLIERFSLSHVPSASVWCALRERRPPVPKLELLALGGPRIPTEEDLGLIGDPELRGEISRLKPLPWSEREIRWIARHIPSERELLLGENASKDALLFHLESGARILHLATHSIRDTRPGRSEGAPAFLLLSGSGESGLVTPEEVEVFPVDSRLVVLSCCESALGDHMRGEGVLGLARSMLKAGALAVVCSVQPVDDRTTAVFMDRFYSAVSRGLGPASALREVQLEFVANGRAPTEWAPFVLVGDGATPLYDGFGSLQIRLLLSIGLGVVVFVTLSFAAKRSWAQSR